MRDFPREVRLLTSAATVVLVLVIGLELQADFENEDEDDDELVPFAQFGEKVTGDVVSSTPACGLRFLR